jgi:hypothetical protein
VVVAVGVGLGTGVLGVGVLNVVAQKVSVYAEGLGEA